MIERLASRGIPRASRAAVSALPGSLTLVAGGMVVSGFAAGAAAAGVPHLMSPVLAGLLPGRSAPDSPACAGAAGQSLAAQSRSGEGPGETLAQLPEGRRSSCSRRCARNVHAVRIRLADANVESGSAEAEDLLLHACAAARDLGRCGSASY